MQTQSSLGKHRLFMTMYIQILTFHVLLATSFLNMQEDNETQSKQKIEKLINEIQTMKEDELFIFMFKQLCYSEDFAPHKQDNRYSLVKSISRKISTPAAKVRLIDFLEGRSGEPPYVKYNPPVKSVGEIFMKFLNDENEEVRQSAVRSLMTTGSFRGCEDKIEQSINHSDHLIGLNCLQLLIADNPDKYIKKVVEFLDCNNHYVRKLAVETLGRFKIKECSSEIARLLDNKNYGNNERCKTTNPSKEEKSMYWVSLEELRAEVQRTAASVLTQMGAKEFSGEIATLLRNKDIYTRIFAGRLLGELGATEYVKELREILDEIRQTSEDPTSGSDLTVALYKLGDKKSIDDLVSVMKSNDKYRTNAMEVIAKLGNSEYTRHIANLIYDKEIGAIAIRTLGQIGAVNYAKDIAGLLNSKDQYIMAASASTLGRFGAKEYAEQIIELLKQSNPLVRIAAARAIGDLDAKEYIGELWKLIGDEGTVEDGWTHCYGKETVGSVVKEVLFDKWKVNK
ncbi:MAG: HEAT repeat domain-containing protein [Planctomycetes bacterium]|nr:HEAT repeat domain-containing protein [Planctomycetota bacterium]